MLHQEAAVKHITTMKAAARRNNNNTTIIALCKCQSHRMFLLKLRDII